MNLRWAFLILPFLLATSLSAQAPGPPGANNQSPHGPGGSDGLRSLGELIESAGELLVESLRPDDWGSSKNKEQWNSLESPRHTVLTFMSAMDEIRFGDEGAWPRALQALGGAGGREEAQSLEQILLRLSDDPSAPLPGPDTARQQDVQRFELFPYGLDHRWVWEALEQPPDGSVALTRRDDGSWVFDAATVAGAARLLESVRQLPPQFDDDDPGAAFKSVFLPTVNNTDWRAWAVMALIVAGGFFFGFLLKRSIYMVAAKLESNASETGAALVRSVATPVALVVAAVALGVGMGFVHLASSLNDLRWAVVEVLMLLAVGWLLLDLLDLMAVKVRSWLGLWQHEYAEMALTAFRRAVRAVAAIILILFALQNLLDINIGAFLGGVGLIGLALSLAAQDTVKNIFGAVMIFLTRPFVIGDWVRFRDTTGEVEDVGLQATRIRLLSGELWTVPNMHFIDTPVENLYERHYLRRELNISIPYDTASDDVKGAVEICREVLREEEIVSEGRFDLDERPPEVSFSHFGDYFLNVRAYYWYFFGKDKELQRDTDRGWFDYLTHCGLVNQRIFERFNEAGIEFAFPTQTMYLASDPNRQIGIEGAVRSGSRSRSGGDTDDSAKRDRRSGSEGSAAVGGGQDGANPGDSDGEGDG